VLQLLRQVSWRELRQRRVRALLFVVAIALGVAMITAIDVSNDSVLVHFGTGIERIAGKADLQITFGTGESGFPEEILGQVRAHPSVDQAMAQVRGALTFADGSADTLELFGVDVLTDGVLEFYETTLRERTREGVVILNDPYALFVTSDLAERRRLRLGEQVDLESPMGVHRCTIHGILEPQGLADVYGGNVAVMDLPAAQQILGKRSGLFGGNVDQIDIALREGVSVSEVQQQLEAALPPDFTVAQPWQRRQDYEHTFLGLRATLTGVSTVALLAAMFIVYSTTGTLVTQRTPTMATLLSIGGSSTRLVRLVIAEAVLLGLLGAVLGVALGVGMAFFTVEGVATGMRLNYSLSFEASSPTFTPWKLLVLYPAVGTAAAVCGAFLPARWLSRIDLLELLRPETRERLLVGVSSRLLLALSAAVLLVAVAALAAGVRSQSASWCTLGAVLLSLAGVVLVLPVVRMMWAPLGGCFERWLGIEGRIASESLNRSIERSGVTIAAIALSISVAVAASSLAGSFRASIAKWYALIGDVAVSARRTQGWVSVPVTGELEQELAQLPGVERIETLRIAQGQLYEGRRIAVVGLSDGFFDDSPLHGARFAGDGIEATLDALKRGDGVMVSENFLKHFQVAIGGRLELPSPAGPIILPLLGVIPDYSSDKGSILLSRRLYRERWQDSLVNYFMLTLAEGATPADVRRHIGHVLRRAQQLTVLETEELVANLDRAVAQAFADLDAIQFLVLVITVSAIADLLISNTLDRRRELAIWRAIGAVDKSLVRSTVLEALAIGVVAAAFGILVGVGSSWVWIRFSYPALVGYVLQFQFSWATAAACFCLATGGAAVAGGVAGYRATREPIDEGLRYE